MTEFIIYARDRGYYSSGTYTSELKDANIFSFAEAKELVQRQKDYSGKHVFLPIRLDDLKQMDVAT